MKLEILSVFTPLRNFFDTRPGYGARGLKGITSVYVENVNTYFFRYAVRYMRKLVLECVWLGGKYFLRN